MEPIKVGLLGFGTVGSGTFTVLRRNQEEIKRRAGRGIEIARNSRPDVILMDINLPGISGIQALGILAEDPTTAHIPVIALSASAMPRDIEKGLEAGFFRYLTKPIKVNELMQTLDMALERAKAQSGRVHQKGLEQ